MNRPIATVLVALSAPALAQNQVWTVDWAVPSDADFEHIQDAVDAAADGDTIVVREAIGAYRGFRVDGKSLVIQGEGYVPVFELGFADVASSAIEIRNLAPDQSVVIRNLTHARTFHVGNPGVDLRDNLGSVWIEDCILDGTNGHGVRVDACAAVTFTRCEVFATSFRVGVRSTDSNLFLVDSTVVGGKGADGGAQLPGVGGAGLEISGGSARLQASTITGGEGGDAGFGPGACFPGGAGGPGVEVLAPAPLVTLADSILAGGAGGTVTPHFGCLEPDGPAGPTTVDPFGAIVATAQGSRGFRVQSPVREGETAAATYSGAAGELAFLLAAPPAGAPLPLPSFEGVLFVDALALVVLPGGVLDASGELEQALVAPTLPPGKQANGVLLQGLLADLGTLEVRLAGASWLSILDAAL